MIEREGGTLIAAHLDRCMMLLIDAHLDREQRCSLLLLVVVIATISSINLYLIINSAQFISRYFESIIKGKDITEPFGF